MGGNNLPTISAFIDLKKKKGGQKKREEINISVTKRVATQEIVKTRRSEPSFCYRTVMRRAKCSTGLDCFCKCESAVMLCARLQADSTLKLYSLNILVMRRKNKDDRFHLS